MRSGPFAEPREKDVAPVALGHNRLLQRLADGRGGKQLLKSPGQAIVRRPDVYPLVDVDQTRLAWVAAGRTVRSAMRSLNKGLTSSAVNQLRRTVVAR